MKKTLTIALSMVLVAAIAVTGTLAFLTASSTELVNKFTFGNTEVTIAEPTWTAALGGDVEKPMKVVPGQTVAKDPTVTVKGSEEVYVYAYVNNALADYVTIGDIGANWTPVVGLAGLNRYNTTVTPAAGGTELEPLFNTVTISTKSPRKSLKQATPSRTAPSLSRPMSIRLRSWARPRLLPLTPPLLPSLPKASNLESSFNGSFSFESVNI